MHCLPLLIREGWATGEVTHFIGSFPPPIRRNYRVNRTMVRKVSYTHEIFGKDVKATFFDVIWTIVLSFFIACGMTADCVGDEHRCPVHATLYELSTASVKLYVPLCTPTQLCAPP
jgi:hypothetical protein